MAWFDGEFREDRVILKLSSFHKNFLPLRFDSGQRKELELEDLAGGARVELDIVLLALVFNNDYLLLAEVFGCGILEARYKPGIGSIMKKIDKF
jgi:hypothetical protein